MKKYLSTHYWKSQFPQTTLFNLLLPLLFASIFVIVVWQIMQVRFTPLEDNIPLSKATLYTDIRGRCRDSIPDSLAYAPIVKESLQVILTKCIQDLKESNKKPRKVQLPHEWRKDIADFPEIQSGKALYHFEFPFNENPQDLWAIVLPAVSQNVAVFVNDNLLGWSGSFETPIARNATRPQMFFIPEGELGKGKNTFDLYVVSQPAEKGFLDQIYIAPAEILKPAFNDYYLFKNTLPWTISLTIAVLSLFMLLLWNYRRNEKEYGLFALAGFFWLIHSLTQLVVDVPTFLSIKLWDNLLYISAGFLGLVAIFFIHRLLEKEYPVFEKVTLYGSIALLTLIVIVPTESLFYFVLFNFATFITMIAAFYVFAMTAIHAFKIKRFEWYALATAVAVIAVFSLRDYQLVIGMKPLYEGRFLHFGAPLLLLSFMWIMLKRFVNTLQKAEKYNSELKVLNKTLENRVEISKQKIRHSFETMRELEKKQVSEQVLLAERSRIMRDMHDGIGVYLTSMIRHLENKTVDKKQLSVAAHNALNDLRLMIDSLGSASTDLSAMLGMFRARIGVALNACKVELEWYVEELPPVKDFGPERALNLLRILQEAFTNALKHSNANRIRLSAYSELDANNLSLIKIKIDDNGDGFSINTIEGNGLKNMQYRAKKIKAELHMDTNMKGTCITIILPLSTGSVRQK
jgi:signal transduction histidine kinase